MWFLVFRGPDVPLEAIVMMVTAIASGFALRKWGFEKKLKCLLHVTCNSGKIASFDFGENDNDLRKCFADLLAEASS